MRLEDYDYDLPSELIAQTPIEPRDNGRLLDCLSQTNCFYDRKVSELPELLDSGDLVVVNDSKVIPARLFLNKRTGAEIEILLLRRSDGEYGPNSWEALIRPLKRCPNGTELYSKDEKLIAFVQDRIHGSDGGDVGVVTFCEGHNPLDLGSIALPPYISNPDINNERYQTIFAAHPGSIAAPTAGLHFTEGLVEGLRSKGIEIAKVNLEIGLDTFRPISVDDPAKHQIHSEYYCIPDETLHKCEQASRVVAVGTTTVRALESCYATGKLYGSTNLYIYGKYQFKVVDVLMTNFHLPRSTLLLMIEAFCGPIWKDIYRHAITNRYRMLSFGDAMIVARES